MWIWRPIMAGHISLAEVKDGTATLVDLLKLNAIMDAQDATQAEAAERANRNAHR